MAQHQGHCRICRDEDGRSPYRPPPPLSAAPCFETGSQRPAGATRPPRPPAENRQGPAPESSAKCEIVQLDIVREQCAESLRFRESHRLATPIAPAAPPARPCCACTARRSDRRLRARFGRPPAFFLCFAFRYIACATNHYSPPPALPRPPSRCRFRRPCPQGEPPFYCCGHPMISKVIIGLGLARSPRSSLAPCRRRADHPQLGYGRRCHEAVAQDKRHGGIRGHIYGLAAAACNSAQDLVW